MRTATFVLLGVAAFALACGGSRDKLLADLQSPRPQDRALAVKKLAEQENPEDLVLFTRAAKDVASIVRGEAAEALGKSHDPRVVDLLGELLEDPDEDVQARAAMALAQVKNDKSKAYLTVQYGRRGRPTRMAIVQALKSSNVPGAMAQVVAAEAQGIWDRNLRALKDGALPERVSAAEELGKSGRAEAVSRLTPLMKDSQVMLAAAAVRGLGYAGDKRTVQAISLLLTENFPELRQAACEALQALNDPQALPTLKAVALEKSSASPFALDAVLALPRSPESDQALCDIALNGAEAEALLAGRAMRARGGCPMEPLADRLARNRDVVPVLVALQGLGPTAASAAPRLATLLASNDAATRRQALLAALELGDKSLVAPVQKLFDQELKEVEALRADWITAELPKSPAAGFGPGEGVQSTQAEAARKREELFQRVEAANQARAEESGKLRVTARPPQELIDDASDDQLAMFALSLKTLGALQGEGALELARKYVTDPSPSVRSAAFAALAHLGESGLSEAAKGLMDPDRDVQTATAKALSAQGEGGQGKLLELLPRLPGDRLRLLQPLLESGVSPNAVEPLLAVLKEGGPDATYAARLLGTLKAPAAVEPLIKYLDDPAGVARREVLWALGEIGDAAAADVVARDLYNDGPDVRAAAAQAMARLGNERHHEPLDALKGDYYRTVRESANAALARVGTPSAEPSR